MTNDNFNVLIKLVFDCWYSVTFQTCSNNGLIMMVCLLTQRQHTVASQCCVESIKAGPLSHYITKKNVFVQFEKFSDKFSGERRSHCALYCKFITI